MSEHNERVTALYKRLRPLLEKEDAPVVLNTLLILVCMCGEQVEGGPEEFKAFVVKEMDRMLPLVKGELQ